MTCQFCGSAIHVWWDCPKKSDGWKPQSVSTAARTDAPRKATEATRVHPVRTGIEVEVGTQAPPVDISGFMTQADAIDPWPLIEAELKRRGRPRNGFDKAAYNRDYMRKRRAAAKAKA